MSSTLLGAVEATPKSGYHSMVTLGQLEGLGDEEIPVVTGAPSGEVGPGNLFGSLTPNFLLI